MMARNTKNGFTLLEVMVASMLLGMLITILTMVFNSSSIAWSTGKASVTEMDVVRNTMSAGELVADNLLPGLEKGSSSTWGVSVSPWNPDGSLRTKRRAVEKVSDNKLAEKVGLRLPNVTKKGSWLYDREQLWCDLGLDDMRITGNAKACVVGVWSYGPDGQPDTDDDISTWPDLD